MVSPSSRRRAVTYVVGQGLGSAAVILPSAWIGAIELLS
jgi:hypothetical protein